MKNKLLVRIVTIVCIVGFIISMLPIVYCSFFNYATGDDLNKSCSTHIVVANHGTLKEFFEGAKYEIGSFYNGWGGNWSACALWTIEPSVWGEDFYHITAYIALLAIMGGTFYLLKYLFQKYIGGNKQYLIIAFMLLSFVTIQGVPSGRTAIFWFAVVANYIIPYGLMLATVVWIDNYMETYRVRYLVYSSLATIFIGGAGYMAAIVTFEILFLYILASMFSTKKVKKLIGVLWVMICFLISFGANIIAPGNRVRNGGELDFSVSSILGTVLRSVTKGTQGAIKFFVDCRLLWIYVPLLVLVSWWMIDVNECKYKFKFPILKILIAYLMYCSMYAPMVFMNDIDGSSGHTNSYWIFFMLVMTLSIVYLVAYIKIHFPRFEKLISIYQFACIGIVVLAIAFNSHFIGGMFSYCCWDYIKSGQLEDFETQMQERFSILHDPTIKDVVLPEMNDQQGPFLHFALIEDPKAYANEVTAYFYEKDRVIAIPREEYLAKYTK